MKNKILFSIVLISFLITNCKKETTNKAGNTTYIVDSIQVFEDSIYSSTIIRSGYDWTSFKSSPTQGTNLIKSVSNDTTKFQEPRYGYIAPNDIWYNSIDLHVKAGMPIYCKTIFNVEGLYGQYNAESDIYNWKYTNDKIAEITKTYLHSGGLSLLDYPTIITRDSFTIDYIGNTIHKINHLTRNVYNETDPSTNGTLFYEYVVDFLYPNNKINQKDMIGIDVNDLILSNKIYLGVSIYFFTFGYGIPNTGITGIGQYESPSAFLNSDPETEILNNLSTYTNSDKLIENMHINNAIIAFYGNDPIYGNLDLNASYIVDANFNNRISEINLLTTAAPVGFPILTKTKSYKLFYHP